MSAKLPKSYAIAVLPGSIGILIAYALTWTSSDIGHTLSIAPGGHFQVWRTIIVLQFGLHLSLITFFWKSQVEEPTSPQGLFLSILPYILGILLFIVPQLSFSAEGYSLEPALHKYTIIFSMFLGFIVLGCVLRDLNKIYLLHNEIKDWDTYMELKRVTKDLLLVAASVMILSVFGFWALQNGVAFSFKESSAALAFDKNYVVAFGGYLSALLALFFSPILISEVKAGLNVLGTEEKTGDTSDSKSKSFSDGTFSYLKSALTIISPFLGALLSLLIEY